MFIILLSKKFKKKKLINNENANYIKNQYI